MSRRILDAAEKTLRCKKSAAAVKIIVDFTKIIYIIQTMRNYEAMFIFHPKLDEEKLEKEIKNVEELITREGKGKVNYKNLGKKTLAYPIKKQNEGYYVNYNFAAQPSGITKIKTGLKHSDKILRFIIFLKEK